MNTGGKNYKKAVTPEQDQRNRKAEKFAQQVMNAKASVDGEIDIFYKSNASGRAHSSGASVSVSSSNEKTRVVVHEIGHVIERQRKNGPELAKAFLDSRVGSETPKSLAEMFPDKGYKRDEMGRRDKFSERVHGETGAWYVGKKYDNATRS